MTTIACADCTQKDELINNYLKLIKLLKTKCQKTAKSFAKNNTLSSDTLYESSLEHSKSIHSNHNPNQLKSHLNPQKSTHQQLKYHQLKLAALIISNKSTKALLNHSINKIKNVNYLNTLPLTSTNTSSLNLQGSLSSLVQQTLCSGKNMQLKNNFDLQRTKQLLSQNYNLTIKNNYYQQKIQTLLKQIKDSEKRFFKQTEKKRESLQTVAEQIRQKTQVILQLQHAIKMYEKALGRSLENITVETVLIEDAEQLKRTCLRLQSINEKLNDDIRHLNSNLQSLNERLLTLDEQNIALKNETKNLKQQNFQLSESLAEHIKMQSTYKSILKRLDRKLQSVQRKQKILYSSMKLNPQLLNSANLVSTKSTELSDHYLGLEKVQSLRQTQIEQKIEEIFAFLFNIKSENYQLNNQQLFDDDELELLKTHKHIYLQNVQENAFIGTKREKIKTQKQLEISHLAQTDQIFYQKPSDIEEHSFFCALDSKKTNQQIQSINSPIGNMKLIEIQIQKAKLIEKISQLKNHHMHIRNVILNLLKVLDLSNPRPETQGILQIVFDFFEYSQDEKASIFKEKKKKFWGIL